MNTKQYNPNDFIFPLPHEIEATGVHAAMIDGGRVYLLGPDLGLLNVSAAHADVIGMSFAEMVAFTRKAPDAQTPKPERMYHLVHLKEGHRPLYLTDYPMTHARCMVMKSKCSAAQQSSITVTEKAPS